MIIKMEREEERADIDTIREVRGRAVEALVEYLKTYRPTGEEADSKHALMGPVGKLLSRIMTTGDINWGAVRGYILSVHKNLQSPRGVSADAAERLEEATRVLDELRSLLPPTKWLKTVEDIDDEVFFRVYRQKLLGRRKGLQKKFHEWLKKRFSSIDELNELLGDEVEEYESFEDVEDPYSTPDQLRDIVKEFWEEYKKKKEKEE